MSQLDPSRLQELMQNNIPPSKLERDQMKKSIDDSKDYMILLDAKITKTQAILQGLLRERDEHITKSYRKVLAPVRRIPPEIVADVLIYSSPETSMLPPFRDEPTLQLTHICSGWRKVALRTPQLWTNVTIHWPGFTFRVYKSVIETWFYRATPLSLSVRIPQHPPVFKAGKTERDVIKLLCNYANRLREFSFALPQPIIDPLLNLPAGSVKMLESVAVYVNDEISSPHDSDATDDLMWEDYDRRTFQDAPSLRYLTLGGQWDSSSIMKNLNIPWHNLTDLTFSMTPYEWVAMSFYESPLLDVLQRCKTLRNCSLFVVGNQNYSWVQGSVRALALYQIRSLKLVGSMHMYRAFFRNLTFPSLENLEFDSERTEPDCNFLFKIVKSSPNIQRFVGKNLFMSSSEMETLLQFMPSLTEWVTIGAADRRILLGIRIVDMISNGILIPKLETLALDFDFEDGEQIPFDWFDKDVADDRQRLFANSMQTALVNMIESRCFRESDALAGQNHVSLARARKIELCCDVEPHLPIISKAKVSGVEVQWENVSRSRYNVVDWVSLW